MLKPVQVLAVAAQSLELLELTWWYKGEADRVEYAQYRDVIPKSGLVTTAGI